MLTDIKRIRLLKREIKDSTLNRYFYDTVLLDTTSYISAIFHAQLFDVGEFELKLSYDKIAKAGVLDPLFNNAYTIMVEICGQSSGSVVESRVFKTTTISIINDENNNKIIKLSGVGALGFYKNIPFGRIRGSLSSATKTTVAEYEEAYFPEKLVISGYNYNNDYVATPLEHLFRKMIYPFGVLGGIRESADTLDVTSLCCPDLGMWIEQDKTRGIGDLLTEEEQSISIQKDMATWLKNWMITYQIGIIGSQYEQYTSSTPLDGYTVAGGEYPKLTIGKWRNSKYVFSDSDGSFDLSNIVWDRNYIGEAPLIKGQPFEAVGTDERVKKYDGIRLCGCYPKENIKNYGFPFGGNVMINGTLTFAPLDINYPVLVNSDFALDDVTTDDNRLSACQSLRAISEQNAPIYRNSITIDGTINVNDKPDIYLGDVVTIKVLNGLLTKTALITGFTYVSEGDGFKIEVDWE